MQSICTSSFGVLSALLADTIILWISGFLAICIEALAVSTFSGLCAVLVLLLACAMIYALDQKHVPANFTLELAFMKASINALSAVLLASQLISFMWLSGGSPKFARAIAIAILTGTISVNVIAAAYQLRDNYVAVVGRLLGAPAVAENASQPRHREAGSECDVDPPSIGSAAAVADSSSKSSSSWAADPTPEDSNPLLAAGSAHSAAGNHAAHNVRSRVRGGRSDETVDAGYVAGVQRSGQGVVLGAIGPGRPAVPTSACRRALSQMFHVWANACTCTEHPGFVFSLAYGSSIGILICFGGIGLQYDTWSTTRWLLLELCTRILPFAAGIGAAVRVWQIKATTRGSVQ